MANDENANVNELKELNELKYGGAIAVVIIGLLVIAVLAGLLPVKEGWKAADVIALAGALTTFLGTVVGAFLGVQVGAAGKHKSDVIAHRALAALAPEAAAKVLRGE